MFHPRTILASAALAVATLAATLSVVALVRNGWTALTDPAGLGAAPVDRGSWIALVCVVAALGATVWAARRLRDLRAALEDDEPVLWI